MPIIRTSRVLYSWLLPVVLGALVYRSVWCGAVGYAFGLRDATVLSVSIRKSTFIRKVSLVNQMVLGHEFNHL
jgi:hypothetical protein